MIMVIVILFKGLIRKAVLDQRLNCFVVLMFLVIVISRSFNVDTSQTTKDNKGFEFIFKYMFDSCSCAKSFSDEVQK